MDTTISRHCAQWCAMGGARQSWPASRAHCCHTYIQLRVKLMPPLTVAQGIVYMKTYITFNNHSGSQSVYKESLVYYNISLTNL